MKTDKIILSILIWIQFSLIIFTGVFLTFYKDLKEDNFKINENIKTTIENQNSINENLRIMLTNQEAINNNVQNIGINQEILNNNIKIIAGVSG